jgi:putative ABC transport system permease protein
MWKFQFESAWLAIKRFPILSALIVVAIALGLAATMSTATIVWRISDDPLPGKSDKLRFVMIDAWEEGGYTSDFEAPDQVTFMDAMAMFEKAPAEKQAPMYQVGLTVQPEREDLAPSIQEGRATSRHFFEMFDYRIIEGAAWNSVEEQSGASVIVISKELKQLVFGDTPAVGKDIVGSNQRFKVIGVFEAPKRLVRVHDVTQGAFGESEKFLIPIRTAARLELDTWGNNNCWKPFGDGYIGKTQSECVWLQLWAQLDTPAEAARYQAFMDNYAAEQKQLGRFPRTANNNKLPNVLEHMRLQKVVSDDQRMASWVGLGFLLVALVNATCLMLAKFLRGSHSAAVHRSLGAARKHIFRMHLLEAMILGSLSAAIGMAVTWISLWAMRFVQPDLADVAIVDWKLLSLLLLLAISATALAGLLPAWRVSRLAPAASLRTQ